MTNLTKILRNAGIGIMVLGISNSVSYYASKDTIEDIPKIHKEDEINRIISNYNELSFVEKPFYYGSRMAAYEYLGNDEEKEKCSYLK